MSVPDELVEAAARAIHELPSETLDDARTGWAHAEDEIVRAVLSAVSEAGWVRRDELFLASARTQELRKTAWATGEASDRLRIERDQARAQADALRKGQAA